MSGPISASTVVFAGDSITHAGRSEADPLGSGYARHAAQALGLDIERCHNTAMPGWTTVEVEAVWAQGVLAHDPDLVVVLAGINDAHRSLVDGIVETEPAAVERRLARMFGAAKAQGARVVAIAPFMLVDGHTSDRHALDLAGAVPAYAEAVRAAAAQAGAEVVDVQSVFDDVFRSRPASDFSHDGVHPNAAAHTVIAETLVHAIVAITPATGTPRR